jgi:biopolymer transport protein ExbD
MKFKPADVSPPDLDMTPMIDIVFQLITFFMVINKFDQAEADERVTLPKDQLAVPPAVQRKNAMMLNFGYVRDQTGQLLSPDPLFFFGDEQVTLEQVRPRLRQESQFYQTIGTDLAEVVVEIRADAEIKSGMVQELIQMCQEDGVGFQRFALKATQKAVE